MIKLLSFLLCSSSNSLQDNVQTDHVCAFSAFFVFRLLRLGHNHPEMVRVRAYIFTDDDVMCVGVSHLTYVEDDAQELAEYLVTHSDCLSTTEHRHLIGRYGLNDSSARADMDQRVTLALANLHTPHNLLGQPSQGVFVVYCTIVCVFMCVHNSKGKCSTCFRVLYGCVCVIRFHCSCFTSRWHKCPEMSSGIINSEF